MHAEQILRRRRWPLILLIIAIAFTGVIVDWTRAPRQQISVALYQTIVLGSYRTIVKPVSDRFIQCRFEPSCSVYSEQAMLAYGFPKGLWLTGRRLFHCMPWVPVGTRDPVPGDFGFRKSDTGWQ